MKYEVVMNNTYLEEDWVLIRVLEGTLPPDFVRPGTDVEFESDKKYFIGPLSSLPKESE